jgi:hypothetical protein
METRDDFRHIRRERALNRWLQVVMAVALAVALNLLAASPGCRVRADLTADRRHSLSSESAALVTEVGRRAPAGEQAWLTIIGLDSEGADTDRAAGRQAARLLEAVSETASAGGREWLRLVRAGSADGAQALATLTARHGPLPPDAAVVLACGPRRRVMTFGELAGLGEAGRIEEALLAALLEVADDRPILAYVTRGHGELSVDDASGSRGMSQLARQLRLANVELRSLSLAGPVPRAASLIIVPGPVSAFSPAEAELIRTYLEERNGRVLLLLDPGREHGLDAILESWAIFSPDAELREPDAARRLPDGDIALRNLDTRLHPIAEILSTLDLPLVAGRLRPVGYDLGSSPDSTLGVWQMVYSSQDSWGETEPRREPARFDPARDFSGPICVALAAERRVGLGTAGTGAAGGRLVVIGSSELATNARLGRGGNSAFLLQSIQWLGGRERAISIPARPLGKFAVTASASQLGTLGWRFLLLPLVIAAVGLAVSAWRRRS